MLRAALWAVPFAIVIAVVNAIVTRDGVTVVFRGGAVPVIGRLDVTAEALVYGGVLGLRAVGDHRLRRAARGGRRPRRAAARACAAGRCAPA